MNGSCVVVMPEMYTFHVEIIAEIPAFGTQTYA